jgi:hypothetical protein
VRRAGTCEQGRKVNGRRRRIAAGTIELLAIVMLTAASASMIATARVPRPGGAQDAPGDQPRVGRT